MEENYCKIPTNYGPEDIVIDSTIKGRDRLIISCCHRKGTKSLSGSIMYYFLDGNCEAAVPFEFEVAEGKYDPSEIRPHGIDVHERDGESFLYVVSHEKGVGKLKYVHRIIVFKIGETKLTYIKDYNTIEMPLISGPNDVFVMDDGTIVFSNPVSFGKAMFKKKQGYVGMIKTDDDTCEVLVANLIYPNGVYVHKQSLFVADTYLNTLIEYTIENGKVKSESKEEKAIIRGGDNISMFENKLIIANHPKKTKFAFHVYLKSKSPSEVFLYDLVSEESESIFYSKGKIISASATAIIYKDYLYVAQVIQKDVLKISLKEKLKELP